MKKTSLNNSRGKTRILKSRLFLVVAAVFAVLGLATTNALMFAPFTGAIFTTDGVCNGTNINIFSTKEEVHLDGGPAHPGAAGLPQGTYCVQVKEPSGLVLGRSDAGAVEVNAAGEFEECYQLTAILKSASSGFTAFGFDNTSNAGGEYKVEVSADCTFTGPTKSDNFKVKPNEGGGGTPQGTVNVIKFYDANADGTNNDGQLINGWLVNIHDGINYDRFTPVSVILAPDEYVVTEATPVETNWLSTTTNPVNLTLDNGETENVEFGNLCLGAGGGKTLGFWSNKNGEAAMKDGGSNAPELQGLTDLNLRTQTGANFDPNTYPAFRTWLLNANATNMAYMLSAQLAAMYLNVESGGVSGTALVYAPCLIGSDANENALGFISINDLIAASNASLLANGNTNFASPARTYQECLKNALDRANNNLNFVQGQPCPFSFPEPQDGGSAF